ncbi:hypothetical protein SAMN05216257_10484 [Meinhardsimonia xiamenensis]|jgi:hypothetical protein|uniref:Uncharacterized protein n=1 Tax=Meinhardsimonia xiamenensis TaxID=990712 RepID=A0A1G9DZ57_9RHOB|nr:hypothetical protein [Meinhardsimonia xiamenensis]PRX29003.1 hypothetical protein LV81_02947 [Meinhardsimonia xiamenensis]SDK69146.1 hypothetical protein SAMN05216257_10484 [Meinhardsimonia xiamenensis]
MREHAARTLEGAQVWDVVQRAGGQLRAVPGAVLGYDMTAVLALAAALGVPPAAVAELVPPIEAVLVRALNARIGERDG